MCLCGAAYCRGSFLYHNAHNNQHLPQQQVRCAEPKNTALGVF